MPHLARIKLPFPIRYAISSAFVKAALVLPSERTFASGIANLARNIFWAVGSSVAGLLMQNGFFGSLGDRRRGQDQLRPALVSCLSKP